MNQSVTNIQGHKLRNETHCCEINYERADKLLIVLGIVSYQ